MHVLFSWSLRTLALNDNQHSWLNIYVEVGNSSKTISIECLQIKLEDIFLLIQARHGELVYLDCFAEYSLGFHFALWQFALEENWK